MPEKLIWQILYIDDDADNLKQIKELLDGVKCGNGTLQVTNSDSFDSALEMLDRQRFDLVILDVRLGPLTKNVSEEAGVATLKSIQTRQFIPIIFYTALPSHVADLGSPLVRILEKTTGAKLLPETIKEVFDTFLPIINRALINHMERVQREYMWDFVAKNWEQLSTSPDHSALAYLLARRLAISLSQKGIEKIILSIGGKADAPQNGIHPMQYYVMPPVESAPLAGDIFHGDIGGVNGYWVLLTPSCDLVAERDNAEFALFAKCNLLTEQEEYNKWSDNPEKYKDSFERFMGNRKKERHYYLPAALTLPDLVIDLQALVTITVDAIKTLQRLASLDSPYAEALLIRFSRYFGRIGVPNLDIAVAISRFPKKP